MSLNLKPVSVIETELGIQDGGPVHAFFTHACRVHMDKYVPYSGDTQKPDHLRENVTETVNTITYNQPYAHAQYVGFTTGPVDPENYTTPGTTAYWDIVMVSTEGKEVEQEVVDYMKTHGGK